MTKYKVITEGFYPSYVEMWIKLLKMAGFEVTVNSEEDCLYVTIVDGDSDKEWVLDTLNYYEDGIFEEVEVYEND